jgi:hypothetical protein
MAKKAVVVAESDVTVMKRDAGHVDALTMETRKGAEQIVNQINQDIGNAEMGRFFALRAGVGLIVVREMCGHGPFGLAMAEMMPHRSGRTLRRYMKGAHDFLETKALEAREIWGPLSGIGAGALSATGGRLMIGDGKSADVPAPVAAIADYLAEKEPELKPAAGDAKADKGSRKLTKAERLMAARGQWHPLASKIQKAGITDRLWEDLPDDELEDVQSALSSVAGAMRQALKLRGK